MNKNSVQTLVLLHKHTLFIVYLTLLVFFNLKRITFGIDLADESYYATFLDEWLKEGFQNAQNRMLHQTAAFLLFPLTYVYKMALGSEAGLILFLRSIYLVIAFAAMAAFYNIINRLQGQIIAALVFGFGFLFIPWSLPAPSYNTIGMFGFLGATSLFASNILNFREGLRNNLLTFLSALFWTAAIVAYPTLFLVFSMFMTMAYVILKNERSYLIRYLFFCAILLFFTGSLFIYVFGMERLISIFQFSNANLNVSTGLWGKIAKIKLQLLQDKMFASLCILFLFSGITLGVIQEKKYLSLGLSIFVGSALIYVSFFTNAVLFLASHDMILMLALLGIYIPIKAIRYKSSNSAYALISILYCSSMVAGLITTITATNALYNFPVGGLLAACLALSFLRVAAPFFMINTLILLLACISMGTISYRYIYGEIYGSPLSSSSVKIDQGVFSGLWTSPTQAKLIYKIMALLKSEAESKKIIALGRLPGIYLLTSQSPQALTTWNYSVAATSDIIHQFYVEKEAQPTMVMRFIDQWSAPLSRAEELLIAQYDHKKEFSTEFGTFIIYK